MSNVYVLLRPMEVATLFNGKSAKSSEGQTVNDMAMHAAILFNGYVFDYDNGGLHFYSDQKEKENYVEHISVGQTKKTTKEFKTWLVSAKAGQFSEAKYSVCDNNCMDFVNAACAFLGVSVASRIQTILKWLRTSGQGTLLRWYEKTVNTSNSLKKVSGKSQQPIENFG